MKNKIELLKEYITAEMQDFECKAEETTSYDRICDFLKYRNIRVEQAWYSLTTRGQNSRNIAERRSELDKQRREKHNMALNSMLGFDKVAEIYGLDKMYEGQKLTPAEIEKHDSTKYGTRKEMTDWFLGLVNEIEDYSISKSKEKRNGLHRQSKEAGV